MHYFLWALTQLELLPHFFSVATHLENPDKSGNFVLIRKKSGKLWFASDVLLQL